MSNIINFNREFEKRRRARARAHELVSTMEDQARPHIRISEWIQIAALEKSFEEVLLEIEKAREETANNWINKV